METTFSLPPNKHRWVMFANDRLNVVQVGHTALKLEVSTADLASGQAVWDIVQWVHLKDIEVRIMLAAHPRCAGSAAFLSALVPPA